MSKSPPSVLRRGAVAALIAVFFLAAAGVVTGVVVFFGSLVDPRYEAAVTISLVVFPLLFVLGWLAQGTTRVGQRSSRTEGPGAAGKGAAR